MRNETQHNFAIPNLLGFASSSQPTVLQALIAFGGENISYERITEVLWPEVDGDFAYASLRTTVKRLRKLLNEKEAIRFIDGKLSLNTDYCWTDVRCFEKIVNTRETNINHLQKASDFYAGHFLMDDSDHWVLSMRDTLHQEFTHLTCRLAKAYEKLQNRDSAIAVYQQGLKVDQLNEEFYQNLMLCYHQTGQSDRIEALYNSMLKFLRAILSPKI